MAIELKSHKLIFFQAKEVNENEKIDRCFVDAYFNDWRGFRGWRPESGDDRVGND